MGLGVTRATPVFNGNIIPTAITCELNGAANVTNLLLGELQTEVGLDSTDLSGFEIMLAVKAVKGTVQ
jgi:hypothetical protein